MGPAMDQQIAAELFDSVLAAARELGVDDAFTGEVRRARARLAGPQIGRDGRLLEWPRELVEREPGHRHLSHLYALFPGAAISPRATPELAAAAEKSLHRRLRAAETTPAVNMTHSGNVGWSLAWNACLWARLGNAAEAHHALAALLRGTTFPNLMDLAPRKDSPGVFQIDGNLGLTAAVAEMLLQSHEGVLHLLPALPAAWPEGAVTGLRARSGFTVALRWREGALVDATVHSALGGACTIRAPIAFQIGAERSRRDGSDEVLTFPTAPGKAYALVPRSNP